MVRSLLLHKPVPWTNEQSTFKLLRQARKQAPFFKHKGQDVKVILPIPWKFTNNFNTLSQTSQNQWHPSQQLMLATLDVVWLPIDLLIVIDPPIIWWSLFDCQSLCQLYIMDVGALRDDLLPLTHLQWATYWSVDQSIEALSISYQRPLLLDRLQINLPIIS